MATFKSTMFFILILELLYGTAICKIFCISKHFRTSTLNQTSLGFLRVCSSRLLKTQWEKEKLFVTSNFSFSHCIFYPFGELSVIFIKFQKVVCKLFQFGRVQNLSFGKGLSRQTNWTRSLVLYNS